MKRALILITIILSSFGSSLQAEEDPRSLRDAKRLHLACKKVDEAKAAEARGDWAAAARAWRADLKLFKEMEFNEIGRCGNNFMDFGATNKRDIADIQKELAKAESHLKQQSGTASSNQRTVLQPTQSGSPPVAAWSQSKPGFLESPFAKGRLINIGSVPPGTTVKDPYTGQFLVIPPMPGSAQSTSGSNTKAGDQLVTVAATGTGFDSSAGQSKGHLDTFKKTDFIEVDRTPNVPREYKKNPTILGFEQERLAAQTDRKKAEAEVQQIKTALGRATGAEKGRLQTQLTDASNKVSTAASRENAARINEEEKAKELEDQSVSAVMGRSHKNKIKEPPPPTSTSR